MNHHAVEKPSVTAQYTKTAEKPDFKRCSDLSGIEKVHRNSIKIMVDLWKRYRVLIEFPGGGVTCPSGGGNRVRGGALATGGFKVNDY